ncbi:MAG TPA: MFS transporter [Anaeromyxobacteraceae bacterium]|nr:MFS transporter [Anaeromyxobacteraceae bacterium]
MSRSDPPASPDPRRERHATVALWAGTTAAYADMYLTQPLLPLLSREWGVPATQASLTVSSVVLAIALASPVHGPLSDAIGRRKVMGGSLALLALPTLACAAAQSLGVLVGLRALQGLLVPGMTAVAIAYAGDLFPARRIAAAVGGVIAASVAGGLLGRLVGGLVASAYGWRATFVVGAAWTVLAAVAMARAPESPRAPGREGGFVKAYAGMLRHLRDLRLLGAFLVGASLFFGWIAIFTYLPYHLAGDPYRLSTAGISWVYAVYAAGVVVSPLAGRYASVIPPRRLMGVGLVIAGAAACATLLHSLALLIAALVVFVIGTFLAQAVAPGFVNASAPEAKGGASALYLAFYYTGGALGSALPGHAFTAYGWPGVIAFSAGALALAFLSNATLCGIPPRRLSAPPDAR